MVDVVMDQNGEGIPHRQLRSENGVKSANGAHESGEEKHPAVSPKTVEAQEPNVDPAEVQRQAPVDGILKMGVQHHVNLVTHLKGQQHRTHLHQPPVLGLSLEPVESANQRQPHEKRQTQHHPITGFVHVDDDVVAVHFEALGRPSWIRVCVGNAKSKPASLKRRKISMFTTPGTCAQCSPLRM